MSSLSLRQEKQSTFLPLFSILTSVRKIPSISNHPSSLAFAVNWALLLSIVAINSYILWGMFGPKLTLEIKSATIDPPKIENLQAKPQENRLIIPSIYLYTKITEGPDMSALDNGAWRRPGTSTPKLGGNTVLAGHRFTYQGKSIFYNLDQVKIGDNIGLTYDGETYEYKVREVSVVEPTNLNIEAPTDDNILTLYTCTPLWSTDKRLVIVAEQSEGDTSQ